MRLYRRLLSAAWLVAGVLFLPPPAEAEVPASPPDAVEVRAAYVFNFVKFVTWPGEATFAPGRPLVIGVYGGGEPEQSFRSLLAGRTVRGRPIAVVPVERGIGARACDLLFVPATARHDDAELVRQLSDLPVLTVGDCEEFLETGGMIRLKVEEKRLRFDVNLEAIGARGLVVSSKLLALASEVRGAEDRAGD
jgi:hypothetical protein